ASEGLPQLDPPVQRRAGHDERQRACSARLGNGRIAPSRFGDAGIEADPYEPVLVRAQHVAFATCEMRQALWRLEVGDVAARRHAELQVIGTECVAAREAVLGGETLEDGRVDVEGLLLPRRIV